MVEEGRGMKDGPEERSGGQTMTSPLNVILKNLGFILKIVGAPADGEGHLPEREDWVGGGSPAQTHLLGFR